MAEERLHDVLGGRGLSRLRRRSWLALALILMLVAGCLVLLSELGAAPSPPWPAAPASAAQGGR